ncbi:MAG TPA: nucleotide exchange factor GrpE [Chloroflexota bacterium]|jgi:molecular chaperone GrpE
MSVQRDQPPIPETDGQPQGESAPEAPASPPTDELETLRAELAEIEQKADEYLRLAQRTQADFINYRRRMDEERAQQARDAGVSVLMRLFHILDDFDRAMSNATEAERQSGWGQGLQLVERNLHGLLAAEGVETIEAEGAEFDPRLHEALGAAPGAHVPDGHVLHVVRQGYRKGDRVLRPTQVIVAKRGG